MKLGLQYKKLVAELVVVILGVAIALAADNWREDLNDRLIEKDYLTRIKNELETGRDQLQRFSDAYATAYESTGILIEYLEGNSEFSDESFLIEHFTKATRTGGPVPGAGISHNAVYLELVSTGRLSLISDPSLRVSFSNYYRNIDSLAANLGALPTDIWTRFRELTGKEAVQYLSSGEFPTGEAAGRLVNELDANNQELLREFRLLHSRLSFHTQNFKYDIVDNVNLVETLNLQID